jgi:hypothetical protein
MDANAQYKDSVFTYLFGNPDTLRELYSALEGIDIPPDMPINITTLTDVLFMGRVNDISFTMDNRLVVLIEHQSTINPNMPLRMLMYLGRVYEKITDRRKAYSTVLEKIPAPECIVLYNGVQPYPDRVTLKLSDAFLDAAGLRTAGDWEPALELRVQVYNINNGHNEEFARKSRTLGEYTTFIEQVRERERAGMSRDDAIRAAIKHCIEHDILKQFLQEHGSEVYNMLLTEWNLEEAQEVWLEQGIERGRKEGREEGWGEGRKESLENVALNALAKGSSIEFVHEITGLDMETIERFKSSQA